MCLPRAAIRLETACWLIPSRRPQPGTGRSRRRARTSAALQHPRFRPASTTIRCVWCGAGLFDRVLCAVVGSAHVYPHRAGHVCPDA